MYKETLEYVIIKHTPNHTYEISGLGKGKLKAVEELKRLRKKYPRYKFTLALKEVVTNYIELED